MSSLVTSEEKVSSMFKSIIMHCEECDKDISIQNEEILELNVGDEGNNLQEILNRHLQKQVDNHFTTCHSLSSKRRKIGINATKISKEQAFLFLSLDKQMKIDLGNDLIVGGKFFSCISAIKIDDSDHNASTVFKDAEKCSAFDRYFKKQDVNAINDVLVCVFQSQDHQTDIDMTNNSYVYSITVIHD